MVIYLEEGKFDIGYEINRKQKYVVRYEKQAIGQFELCFERRMYFLIKAHSVCTGVFIRKKNWQEIVD
jgi:hypothetical protein